MNQKVYTFSFSALIIGLVSACGSGVGPVEDAVMIGPIRVIAGNSNSGLGGSAQEAVFLNHVHEPNAAGLYMNGGSVLADPSSFVVTSDRTVFFRDRVRGILKVGTDGIQRLVIPTTGTHSGDGGAAASATLKEPIKIALDYSGGLLVLDWDRIRRIDTAASPMTITTILGGGSSTADGVGPLDVQFHPPGVLQDVRNNLPLIPLPNGDIYFASDTFYLNRTTAPMRVRIYRASTAKVESLTPSGTGCDTDASLDISSASAFNIGITFNPTTSVITKMNFGVRLTCSFNVDPATGVSTAPHPVNSDFGTSANARTYKHTSRMGELYTFNRHLSEIYIRKFNPDTNRWNVIVGAGTEGNCTDGTAATSCKLSLADVYVAEDDTVYFVSRGRIRYKDSNGNVQTLMGQSLSYGDGGAATSARLNRVTSIAQRDSGEIFLMDEQERKIREFSIGGNITTIAGNGEQGTPAEGTAATGQPLYYKASGRTMDAISSSITITTAQRGRIRRWSLIWRRRGPDVPIPSHNQHLSLSTVQNRR